MCFVRIRMVLTTYHVLSFAAYIALSHPASASSMVVWPAFVCFFLLAKLMYLAIAKADLRALEYLYKLIPPLPTV